MSNFNSIVRMLSECDSLEGHVEMDGGVCPSGNDHDNDPFDEIGLGNQIKLGEAEDCDDNDYDDDDHDFNDMVEDPDDDSLIMEALIVEAYGSGARLQKFVESRGEALVRCNVLSEKSIVRLDKYAKLSRAESQAVYILAKKNNDRDYNKLVTIYKLRKVLKDKLNKKYANAARRYAKEMIKKGGAAIKATNDKM